VQEQLWPHRLLVLVMQCTAAAGSKHCACTPAGRQETAGPASCCRFIHSAVDEVCCILQHMHPRPEVAYSAHVYLAASIHMWYPPPLPPCCYTAAAHNESMHATILTSFTPYEQCYQLDRRAGAHCAASAPAMLLPVPSCCVKQDTQIVKTIQQKPVLTCLDGPHHRG
jgi:hypothetical protein